MRSRIRPEESRHAVLNRARAIVISDYSIQRYVARIASGEATKPNRLADDRPRSLRNARTHISYTRAYPAAMYNALRRRVLRAERILSSLVTRDLRSTRETPVTLHFLTMWIEMYLYTRSPSLGMSLSDVTRDTRLSQHRTRAHLPRSFRFGKNLFLSPPRK